MAKKREVNFFIKIDSDEDLEKLLQVKSLISEGKLNHISLIKSQFFNRLQY